LAHGQALGFNRIFEIMDLDFSEEQKQLKDYVRRFLEANSSAARIVLDTGATHDSHLWRGLADLGYAGTAIPEPYGGLGLGYLELCVIAEELGRSLAPVPFSSSIYLATECLLMAGSEEQKQSWLPRLASGESIGTFALSEQVGAVSASRVECCVSNGRLTGTKLPVADGMIADFCIVAARNESSLIDLYLVELSGNGVDRVPVSTIDPTRGHARLTFDHAPATTVGKTGEGWSHIEGMLDRAAVLFAFEQIGGADFALEMARDYALERRAFGRQIGSFQALKHMLADMYVAATLARSNAYFAAWALSTDAAELPRAAAAARISATQAFQLCSRHNIQVHGGMGFTWESDCHLYYRRSNLLAINLGSISIWEDRLIDQLRSPH
jgi:alkylation response protein AidB-like acyl-CoA dehydrogenase